MPASQNDGSWELKNHGTIVSGQVARAGAVTDELYDLGEGVVSRLQKSANLADLTDPVAARDNLGLTDTGITALTVTDGELTYDGHQVWHTGNDGASSGLAADYLDGQHGAYFTNRDNHTGTQDIDTIAGLLRAICPPGMVSMFDRESAPDGWLEADGTLVSTTAYADLFAALGHRHILDTDPEPGALFLPYSDSLAFRLPDLRGEFLRGLDNGRGVDAYRVLGSAQGDAIKQHNHESGVCVNPGFTSQFGYGPTSPWRVRVQEVSSYQSEGSERFPLTGSTGGDETRPRNVALLACVKV